MPCIKCSNGKWKYGQKGRCQFDTKKKCEDAAAAIHINKKEADSCSGDDLFGTTYEFIIIDELLDS